MLNSCIVVVLFIHGKAHPSSPLLLLYNRRETHYYNSTTRDTLDCGAERRGCSYCGLLNAAYDTKRWICTLPFDIPVTHHLPDSQGPARELPVFIDRPLRGLSWPGHDAPERAWIRLEKCPP